MPPVPAVQGGRYNLCPNMEFYATPPIDGAFCRYVLIDDDMAHPVPDSMSDDAAALLEPLSVAITTMRKAHVAPGTSILIAGAGPIGVICAQTARAFGAARIVVTDPCRRVARRRCSSAPPKSSTPLAVDVGAIEPVDAFVDATGVRPPRWSAASRQSAPRVTSSWSGWAPTNTPCPSATSRTMEINLTGVFRYTDTWPAAIHLVSTGAVDLDGMVTGRYDLEHAGEALDSDTDPTSLKSIVVPS